MTGPRSRTVAESASGISYPSTIPPQDTSGNVETHRDDSDDDQEDTTWDAKGLPGMQREQPTQQIPPILAVCSPWTRTTTPLYWSMPT
ncbi:protein of unknown function [Nitrospira defluvii]|uniref:Uncharacterized protein n=1 Tax=Nitrospira defluvii TaxID=330214 RepID=D8PB18_9BACT|nr:protein of unknown function [Nitrospira defluvii]